MLSFSFTCFPADRRSNRQARWSGLVLALALTVLMNHCFPAFAQEMDVAGLASETHLKLLAGAKSQTYEFFFYAPEDEFNHGIGWVTREIRVDGDLGIVEERLSRDVYYAIVRLAAFRDRVATGSIAVCLRKGRANTMLPPLLSQPTHLQVSGNPYQPEFNCRSEGCTTQFVIHEVSPDKMSWSRAFTDDGRGRLDEGCLHLNAHYILEVRQSNAAARYSEAAWLKLQLVKAPQTCPACQGSGQESPTSPSDEGGKPCESCRGTGQVMATTLITSQEQRTGVGSSEEAYLSEPNPACQETPEHSPTDPE
ncbi:MAG: hypothetical protein WA705_16985 [Candidatus Ozemobacteraceae bacterium]